MIGEAWGLDSKPWSGFLARLAGSFTNHPGSGDEVMSDAIVEHWRRPGTVMRSEV